MRQILKSTFVREKRWEETNTERKKERSRKIKKQNLKKKEVGRDKNINRVRKKFEETKTEKDTSRKIKKHRVTSDPERQKERNRRQPTREK